MKKENANTDIKKNTVEHLAPGGRGWHVVPGEGVLKEEDLMHSPSSPLQGTSPAKGEVNGGFTLFSPRPLRERMAKGQERGICSGFTLIELLVVVLIIGILAAVAVPQYQKAVEKSRITELYVLLSSWAKAQQIYYLANETYASDYAKLDIQLPYNTTTADDDTYEGRNFEGGEYTFHKCGDDSCLYAYKSYKNGYYGLQVNVTPQKFYCMATADNQAAENLCKSLGFTSFESTGNLAIGKMNYYTNNN